METTVSRYSQIDAFKVLCKDCSTRTTGVMIPSDEVTDHDAWHEGLVRVGADSGQMRTESGTVRP
jgi:hypothetical protein